LSRTAFESGRQWCIGQRRQETSGVDEYITDDFEREMAGEPVNPLDWAQDGADDETKPLCIPKLFDVAGDEFEGFHHNLVTDLCHFHPVNVQDCLLDGGSAYKHP